MEEEKRDKELFTRVRREKNQRIQAEVFGKLADTKDSRAIKISTFAKSPKAESRQTLIDFDEQYFADMKRKNSKSFLPTESKDSSDSVYHSYLETGTPRQDSAGDSDRPAET